MLPYELTEILSRVRDGKLTIYLEHRRLDAIVNRPVYGLLTAVLFVGSSLIVKQHIPPTFKAGLFNSRKSRWSPRSTWPPSGQRIFSLTTWRPPLRWTPRRIEQPCVQRGVCLWGRRLPDSAWPGLQPSTGDQEIRRSGAKIAWWSGGMDMQA